MTRETLSQPRAAVATWESSAAHMAVFIIAIRYRFAPDIPVGFILAACLLPVTAQYFTRHRGAVAIVVLCILSAISGLLLTLTHSSPSHADGSLAIVQTSRVLGIAVVLAALLWARALLGLQRLVLTFGLGTLASAIMVSGVNPGNPWKFSFSVPVTLIALSIPIVYAHRWRQMVVVLALVAVSALNDSRSAAGLLLVAGALTVTQRGTKWPDLSGRWRSWTALGRIALIGIGAYFITQAAILEGMLGEAARTRTEAQISQSGSAIVGGRPEMGAALLLIGDRPWGYGAGSLATYDNIMLAKTGMKSLGYDPNNGYVENYMFGYGLEVHSLLGDVWLSFGLAGALLAVVVVSFALFGLGYSLSLGTATTVTTFLILRLTWDFGFSPFPSAMVLLPLTLAVALPALPDVAAPRRAKPPS